MPQIYGTYLIQPKIILHLPEKKHHTMSVPKKWITRAKDGTPEWHAVRNNHIGASEIGIILGLSEYRPTKTELYHIKVGTHVRANILNAAIFHGKHQEEYVAWLWQYYSEPGDSYIHNHDSDTIVRKCQNVNGVIVNPKYPYLSCNLDREALKLSPMLDPDNRLSNVNYPGNFPVECKTINGFAASKWESGVPQTYVAQVHQQMIITETDYSEIAILVDGRNFQVHRVPFDKRLGHEIIDKGHDFWNLVKAGREYYSIYTQALALGKDGEAMAEDALAKIYELEPEPDGSDAYKEYLSERFKKEQEVIMGDDELRKDAATHKYIQTLIKTMESVETEYANRLRYFCAKTGAEKVNFQDGSYVSFTERKNSANRVLSNRSKDLDFFRTRKIRETLLRETIGVVDKDEFYDFEEVEKTLEKELKEVRKRMGVKG